MANLVAMTPLVMVTRAEDEYRLKHAQWSLDLPTDLLLVAAMAWMAYVLVTSPFPNLRYWPLVERFWDTVQGRDRAAEEANRLKFSSDQFPAYGVLAGLGTAAQLPRSHLLGTGAELERIQVMLVMTDDPVPMAAEPGAVTATVQSTEIVISVDWTV